jgi:hypothetical protein
MAAADVCSGARRARFMQWEEAPLDPSAFSQCVQLFPHFFTIEYKSNLHFFLLWLKVQ